MKKKIKKIFFFLGNLHLYLCIYTKLIPKYGIKKIRSGEFSSFRSKTRKEKENEKWKDQRGAKGLK